MRNVAARPSRLTLTNLATAETLEAQFNPETLTELVEVQWARLQPVGLSHDVLQYRGTASARFPLDLVFVAKGEDGPRELGRTRRFLHALAYPGEPEAAPGSPPRALVVWPNVLAFVCVVERVRIRLEDFDRALRPTRMVATLELAEARDVRLTMPEVLDDPSGRLGGYEIPAPGEEG